MEFPVTCDQLVEYVPPALHLMASTNLVLKTWEGKLRLRLCQSISRRFLEFSIRAQTAIDDPPPRALPASSPPFEAPDSLVRLLGQLIKNTQAGHESARDLQFSCGSTLGI
jgi:hypothetical protein